MWLPLHSHRPAVLETPPKEMPFENYKITALNATRVDEKQEKSLNIELPAQSDHPSKVIRFLYEALSTVAREKVPINGWDDNDYTYLSILVLDLHLNKEVLSNLIYKPGEPFIKPQVLVAEATLAYIQKMDSIYGSGEDDYDDEVIHWLNDRSLLRVVLNPGFSKEHPIFGDVARDA